MSSKRRDHGRGGLPTERRGKTTCGRYIRTKMKEIYKSETE
jgi:hypothetical protein